MGVGRMMVSATGGPLESHWRDSKNWAHPRSPAQLNPKFPTLYINYLKKKKEKKRKIVMIGIHLT